MKNAFSLVKRTPFTEVLVDNVEAKRTEIGRTDKNRRIIEYTHPLVVKEYKLEQSGYCTCTEFILRKSQIHYQTS